MALSGSTAFLVSTVEEYDKDEKGIEESEEEEPGEGDDEDKEDIVEEEPVTALVLLPSGQRPLKGTESFRMGRFSVRPSVRLSI